MANKEWIKAGADGKTFGERLGDLITDRGTSATAVAKACGIYQPYITEYQKTEDKNGIKVDNPRAPDCGTIVALSRHFSVSSDYLLGLSEVQSNNLTVQEIHKMTGLEEDNIASLVCNGPFGQNRISALADAYKTLVNDFLRFASMYDANRRYSRFLKYVNYPDPPQPQPLEGENSVVVSIDVVGKVIGGTGEEGVNYADGYTAIAAKEYAEIILDDFLRELRAYLYNHYFTEENGVGDDGID